MRQILLLTLSVLFLVSCTSKFMDEVTKNESLKIPEPDKVVVYFIRNTSFGGFYHTHIYDDVDYIGTLYANTNMVYTTKAGKHTFMIEDASTERVDFLEAELASGKVYYAVIVPIGKAVEAYRGGRRLPNFVFRPQNGQINQADIDESIRTTTQVTINNVGRAWGEQNKPRAEAIKKKQFPEWDHQAILKAESGREITQTLPKL